MTPLCRRGFFGAAAAAVLPAPPASKAEAVAEPVILRPLYRLEDGRWVRRRMMELKVGDLFRMESPETPDLHGKVFEVNEPPTVQADGAGGCVASNKLTWNAR